MKVLPRSLDGKNLKRAHVDFIFSSTPILACVSVLVLASGDRHTAPVLPIIETTILVFFGSQVGDERYAFLFSAIGHFKKVLIEASTGRRIIAGGDGTLPLSSRDDLTVTRPLYSKWHEVSTGVPRPCCMVRAVHQAGDRVEL